MQRTGIFLWILLFVTPILAAPIPKGCQPVRIAGNNANLSVDTISVILLQNMGDNTLWITHPADTAGASAGWTSQLDHNRWSALVLDRKDFMIDCIESKPGHEQHIACQDVLKACVWKKVKIPEKETGSFWAVENATFREMESKLIERGFVIQTRG